MWKKRIIAIVLLAVGVLIGFFVYRTQITGSKPFVLGLDLSGGTHLIYRADISAVPKGEVNDRMVALRDVIERRINIFGVSEPVIQTEHSSLTNEERLVVDLPGVTDIAEATKMIGQTPLLEFRVENDGTYVPELKIDPADVDADGNLTLNAGDALSAQYMPTDLTGRYLKRATLEFNQTTNEPIIGLQFDETGSKLFEDMTGANIGKSIAIFLDGSAISMPVVNEKITGGQAVINGSFSPDEAKLLVGRLNSGALPVPIELISTQTIGASLGADAVDAGVKAGMIGFIIIALFLILYYRFPGLVAVIALSVYVAIILALFKVMPVTLSAAAIAGFIISLGLAVDANILIFERMKEEMKKGHTVADAMREGFQRAWPSIRDSNISTIISMAILFMFGSALIKGFALTFGLGVLVSMLSAVTLSRRFLYSVSGNNGKFARIFYGSGAYNGSSSPTIK